MKYIHRYKFVISIDHLEDKTSRNILPAFIETITLWFTEIQTILGNNLYLLPWSRDTEAKAIMSPDHIPVTKMELLKYFPNLKNPNARSNWKVYSKVSLGRNQPFCHEITKTANSDMKEKEPV